MIPRIPRSEDTDPLFGLERDVPVVHMKSAPGACLSRPCYRYIDLLRLYRPNEGYDFDEMYSIYACPDSALADQCVIDYNKLINEISAEQDVKRSEIAKAVRAFDREEVVVGSAAPLRGAAKRPLRGV